MLLAELLAGCTSNSASKQKLRTRRMMMRTQPAVAIRMKGENSEPVARAAAGRLSNGAVAGELKTCPPPPYPPSQGNIEDILQVLLQERKEIREAQKRIEAQLAILTELITRLVTLFVSSNSNTSQPSNSGNQEEREDALLHEEDVENLNHKNVHECLQEVEEENVDQEVTDEDKESKGMQIIQSSSSETPPESPSELHFEWVNPSAMNFLGPQYYGLLETDGQLKALCGVLDKKKMDSLGLDKSRFITCGEAEFKAYSGHLHKLYNNRTKVRTLNLRKNLGP
ncbi:hypothetical protein PIB30_076165 [Stylosanthes scabra]|uniref:Uncharacterized protein n=1 Tax=Stylosanthes scabra TaxID=79078 RepID=A0ABU6RQG3_9FABA|nr:hypothetical protein [Stylosanthes scabra]